MALFDELLAAGGYGAQPAPAPGAMDPFAMLRNVDLERYSYTNPGLNDAEAGGFMGQDQTYSGWTPKGTLVDRGDGMMVPSENAFDGLKAAGFESKYNRIRDLTDQGFPNILQATVQRPGQHKYDTYEIFYSVDPDTGKATMLGEPVESRQVSSRETMRDFIEEGVTRLGGAVLAAYTAGGGTFGLTGMAGAAAGGAGTGAGVAAAAGADAGDIAKAGVIGGIGGAAKFGIGEALGGTGTNFAPGGDANLQPIDSFPEGPGGYTSPELVGGSFGPGSGQLGTAEYLYNAPFWELPMDDPRWQPNPGDYTTPDGSLYEQTVEITAPPITDLGQDPTIFPGDPAVDAAESAGGVGTGVIPPIPGAPGTSSPLPTAATDPSLAPVAAIPLGPAGDGSILPGGALPVVNPIAGLDNSILPGGALPVVGGGVTLPNVGGLPSVGGGFDWGNLLNGLLGGLTGLYGMNLADEIREKSDPFAKYRDYYGERLMELEKNPSLITKRPGWTAGIEALDRSAASSGYLGSGNAMAALSRYGGSFYNDETKRLAELAGAPQTPGAGLASAAQLDSNSLAAIGYGMNQLFNLFGNKP